MSQHEGKPRSKNDEDLEREIRNERKYSLDEAIGRLAGSGAMKGAPPTTRIRQARAVIQEYLGQNLGTGTGCLQVVLLQQVMGSELLLNNLDQPLVVLASYIQRVLALELLLTDLVRQTDTEWGRTYDERPHFEIEGSPPDQDDPYTLASVSHTLSDLLQKLGTAIQGAPKA